MKYKAWANDKKWLPEGPCCQMLNGFPEGKTLGVHQLKGSVLKYKTPSLENRQWWDESASDEMLRDDNKQQWPLKRLKATISPKKNESSSCWPRRTRKELECLLEKSKNYRNVSQLPRMPLW